MLQRFACLCALLLSSLLMIAERTAAGGETYRLKSFGAAAPSSDVLSGPRYAVASVDHTWFDAERDRSVPARIYYPTDAARPCPVIIFSTGLGRSRDDCAYLGRHWASCGYISVHVQHKGSDEEVRQGNLRPRKELQRAFYAPQNIRNRPLDMIFVIHQLDLMQRQRRGPRKPLRPDANRGRRPRFRCPDGADAGRRGAAGKRSPTSSRA